MLAGRATVARELFVRILGHIFFVSFVNRPNDIFGRINFAYSARGMLRQTTLKRWHRTAMI